jgi:putative endonuclease
MSNRETGERGEELALRHLEGEGYEALERNYRTRYGEIDLVVRRGATLVFVEVKSLRGTGFGEPLEAVTPRKQEQVRPMAEQYLAEKEPGFAKSFEEMRFDAVGILVGRGGAGSGTWRTPSKAPPGGVYRCVFPSANSHCL